MSKTTGIKQLYSPLLRGDDSCVALLYGYEIDYVYKDDDEYEPEFVWDEKLGTLYITSVDYEGTKSKRNMIIIGVLLGKSRGLHYSSCVTTEVPSVEHVDIMQKFYIMNKKIFKSYEKPKIIAFASSE